MQLLSRVPASLTVSRAISSRGRATGGSGSGGGSSFAGDTGFAGDTESVTEQREVTEAVRKEQIEFDGDVNTDDAVANRR